MRCRPVASRETRARVRHQGCLALTVNQVASQRPGTRSMDGTAMPLRERDRDTRPASGEAAAATTRGERSRFQRRLPRDYSRFDDGHPGVGKSGVHAGRIGAVARRTDLLLGMLTRRPPGGWPLRTEGDPGVELATAALPRRPWTPTVAPEMRPPACESQRLAGISRVEPTGFEPVTSCLQSRRSPN